MGGAERQLVLLARGLASRGIHTTILTFYNEGQLLHEVDDPAIRVSSLRKSGRWDAVAFLIKLFMYFWREKTAIIYSFLPGANVMAAGASLFLPQARFIWGVRASNMDPSRYDWLSRAFYFLETKLSSRPASIIANSKAGRDFNVQRGFPAEKIFVIGNGIETERFFFDDAKRTQMRLRWGVDQGEMLVGIVARLDPMKDHKTFLRASSIAAAKRHNLRFVCVGDGPPKYREELHAFAVKLGLSEKVIWADACRDMVALYSALDLFVLSSAFGEGFPNVVAEAMACERCCIVTDVGDSASVVGEWGTVVPVSDPLSLAQAIIAHCDLEKSATTTRGRNARRRVQDRFSTQNMVSDTIAVLFR